MVGTVEYKEEGWVINACGEKRMSSRLETINEVLNDLRRASPDIEACAVVSVDGLPIASVLPPNVDEAKVAAMAAAIQGVADRVSKELNVGVLRQVYIEGENGGVLVMNASPDAALVVVVRKGARLGLILYEVRRAAERLAEVFA